MPGLHGRLLQVQARPALEEELLLVHAPDHLERVRTAVKSAARDGAVVFLDADTVVSGASWDAGLAAVGCVLTAAELVLRGEARNAFAASRPPGHHATQDRAMGFCLFNNVAITARALQRRYGLERILIVDWDVHHGNGTQDIFFTDPSVFYLSLHLSPHYPGTGSRSERGNGDGHGATLNVPLARGAGGAEFQAELRAALETATAGGGFDFVLVSAGFDCLARDPLGGLELEPDDLHAVTLQLLEVAERAAGGRLAIALEGGYVPDRLGAGVVAVLRALTGLPVADAVNGAGLTLTSPGL
jgi:acetoin utilization deacetylase AcuC-like enzyme